MTRRVPIAAVVLCLCTGAVATPAGQSSAWAPSAVIVGRVMDEQGGVLPGVTVGLGTTAIIVVTNARGDFQMTPVTTGDYMLRVTMNGFDPAFVPVVISPKSKRVDVGVVRLRPRGHEEAVIVDIEPPLVQPSPSPAVNCNGALLGARTSHALAFDFIRRQVVLFGGESTDPVAPYPSSLWAWNGTQWTCIAGGGPAGRAGAFMAFDVARGRLVLFGGRTLGPGGQLFRDTWEWDGREWSRRDTAGPGPRYHGAIAYDAVRHQVVLAGGGSPSGRLADAWAWNGRTWDAIALRMPAGGVVDALIPTARGLLLLAAVPDGASSCAEGLRARVFSMAGDALVANGEPGPCLSPVAPAAAIDDGLVLYLGWNANEPPSSWTWRNGRWGRHAVVPARRRDSYAAYDEYRRRVVLYGGSTESTTLGDTWEWDGSAWRRVG